MSKKNTKVPIHTIGRPGVPSKTVASTDNFEYFSAYTGVPLDTLPTYGTKTDDPTGKNEYYHGGIQDPYEHNIIMCHSLFPQGYPRW